MYRENDMKYLKKYKYVYTGRTDYVWYLFKCSVFLLLNMYSIVFFCVMNDHNGREIEVLK